jgi:hypothetical protein
VRVCMHVCMSPGAAARESVRGYHPVSLQAPALYALRQKQSFLASFCFSARFTICQNSLIVHNEG